MLLHDIHPLPDGSHVRLRLPHLTERDALHELLAEHGLGADDLDLRRALRWSSERHVVVATRWDGTRERLCGLSVVDRRRGALTIIAPPEVATVLERVLHEYEHRRVA